MLAMNWIALVHLSSIVIILEGLFSDPVWLMVAWKSPAGSRTAELSPLMAWFVKIWAMVSSGSGERGWQNQSRGKIWGKNLLGGGRIASSDLRAGIMGIIALNQVQRCGIRELCIIIT